MVATPSFKGVMSMLERLFSLFFSVLNGIALTDFFIGVMAAGFLFGMATLIRYIFVGGR